VLDGSLQSDGRLFLRAVKQRRQAAALHRGRMSSAAPVRLGCRYGEHGDAAAEDRSREEIRCETAAEVIPFPEPTACPSRLDASDLHISTEPGGYDVRRLFQPVQSIVTFRARCYTHVSRIGKGVISGRRLPPRAGNTYKQSY